MGKSERKLKNIFEHVTGVKHCNPNTYCEESLNKRYSIFKLHSTSTLLDTYFIYMWKIILANAYYIQKFNKNINKLLFRSLN